MCAALELACRDDACDMMLSSKCVCFWSCAHGGGEVCGDT